MNSEHMMHLILESKLATTIAVNKAIESLNIQPLLGKMLINEVIHITLKSSD